jgi:acetylornithine/succinyldiaminopimelate/putrescine aminotransferase
MLEPIQGEGGVIVPDQDYLFQVRKWCDERGLLLILDEVQTGFGRTGSLFAYQDSGIVPDILTLGKGLGGGVPIAAFLAKEQAAVFQPGDHGTTFGGNALSCAAAVASVSWILDHDVPGHAKKMGEYLVESLRKLQARQSAIVDVRGRGLLLAVEFDRDVAREVVATCRDDGLLLNPVRPNAIRFMPPLIITREDVDRMLGILEPGITKALAGEEGAVPVSAPSLR